MIATITGLPCGPLSYGPGDAWPWYQDGLRQQSQQLLATLVREGWDAVTRPCPVQASYGHHATILSSWAWTARVAGCGGAVVAYDGREVVAQPAGLMQALRAAAEARCVGI